MDDFEMANFVFYRPSAEAETGNAHLIVEAEWCEQGQTTLV